MSNPKKYYWLKLFDNFFADPKIKKLRGLAGGDTYIVILLKMMLHTVKTNGVYEYQGLLGSTLSKELVWVLDENEDHIQAVLIYLEKTKLIEEIEEGCFLLNQVPLMLGTEGDSAERKRAQREREKEKSVTLSHDSHTLVTKSHTEIEKRREELEERRERGDLNLKSFLDLKSFMNNNRKNGKGEQHKFIFQNKLVAISDKGIPYFLEKGQSVSLTFTESDNFYKAMFQKVEYVISIIEQGA